MCGYIRRENWLQTSREICIEYNKSYQSDFQFELGQCYLGTFDFGKIFSRPYFPFKQLLPISSCQNK